MEQHPGPELNAEQAAAVRDILQPPGRCRMIIVLGGPGNGKTTAIKGALCGSAKTAITTCVFATMASAALRIPLGPGGGNGMTVAMFISIWKGAERLDTVAARKLYATKFAELSYPGMRLALLAITRENTATHGRVFIDELSMISSSDMDTMCRIFADFGNVVFVLSGDPEQLRNPDSTPFHLCAEIQKYTRLGQVVVHTLKFNFRFARDPELGEAVTGFREQIRTPNLFALITPYMFRPRRSFRDIFNDPDAAAPVILAPDNKTINAVNDQIVKTLVDESPGMETLVMPYLEDKTPVDQTFAEGVPVVMTENVRDPETKELHTYNGTNGVVTRLLIRDRKEITTKNRGALVVTLESGDDVIIDVQKVKDKGWVVPLRVAYAKTVHRFQGEEIDPERPVWIYVTPATHRSNWLVALSRLKTLRHLHIALAPPHSAEGDHFWAYERMHSEPDVASDGMKEYLAADSLKSDPTAPRQKRQRTLTFGRHTARPSAFLM